MQAESCSTAHRAHRGRNGQGVRPGGCPRWGMIPRAPPNDTAAAAKHGSCQQKRSKYRDRAVRNRGTVAYHVSAAGIVDSYARADDSVPKPPALKYVE